MSPVQYILSVDQNFYTKDGAGSRIRQHYENTEGISSEASGSNVCRARQIQFVFLTVCNVDYA